MPRPPPPNSLSVEEDLSGLRITLPRMLSGPRMIGCIAATCFLPTVLAMLTPLWSQQDLILQDVGLFFLCGWGLLLGYLLVGISLRWILTFLPLRMLRGLQISTAGSIFSFMFLLPAPVVVPMAHLIAFAMSLDVEPVGLVDCGALVILQLVLLGLTSIRRPRLTIDNSVMSLQGFGKRRYPLEDISLAAALRANTLLSNRAGAIDELSSLTKRERDWLLPILEDAIAQRTQALTAAGHDLSQPAVVPEALKALQDR